MTKTALFSLIPLLVVIVVAIFLIVYKNNKTQATRRRQREPFINQKKKDESEKDFTAPDSDKDLIDDFIDDDYLPEKDETVTKPQPINQNLESHVTEIPMESRTDATAVSTAHANDISEPQKSLFTDIILFNLNANSAHPYTGYELLQALLTAGLRFGKMSIFHRHEESNGRGAILFSLASALEPGTFELNKMGAFSSPGLVLFMRVSAVKDPASVFALMYSAAQQLIDDLGGEILDEHRQPFTEEKINDLRLHIETMAQRGQTADLFPNG